MLSTRNRQYVFRKCLSRPWLVLARPDLLFTQGVATATFSLQSGVRTHDPCASIRDPGEKSGLEAGEEMNDTSILLWGVVFGSIGLGFFIYGRKQQAVVPLVVGIALFVVPYVIANLYLLLLAGVVLVALPYFVRL